MPERYWYFFLNTLEPVLKQGGLFIVVLQPVLKLLVCHTKLLSWLQVQETAVINEHYTLNSLLTL